MHNNNEILNIKINENINKYNKKKCRWKKYTRKSVFFILISLIILITKKLNEPNYNYIDFGIYITILNLLFSIIFHYEYCPYDYKFYIRLLDILIAGTTFSVAIFFGNKYTYILGFICCLIFYTESNYDDDINIYEVGILHTLIHIIHPIMMYTILFIN